MGLFISLFFLKKLWCTYKCCCIIELQSTKTTAEDLEDCVICQQCYPVNYFGVFWLSLLFEVVFIDSLFGISYILPWFVVTKPLPRCWSRSPPILEPTPSVLLSLSATLVVACWYIAIITIWIKYTDIIVIQCGTPSPWCLDPWAASPVLGTFSSGANNCFQKKKKWDTAWLLVR